MTSNDYLNQLKEMQQNPDRVQYSYKLYLRQGQDYIYQCDLTREQFEIHRKTNNEDYCFSGIHSMRDSTISSESVLETKTYYNTVNERYKVWNNFLEAFISENGITKVEEFKEFIEDFVIVIEFSRTNFSNNAKLVSELDKKYINLFV